MAGRRRLRDLTFGHALRRRSARFRLTALYCALFLPSGIVLVVITYVVIVLVQNPNHVLAKLLKTVHAARRPSGPIATGLASQGSSAVNKVDGTTVIIGHWLTLDGRELFVGSCIVLVAMFGGSVLLGWFVAGRVLRPLRVMTTTTRQISEHNLHERLALAGPDDELKDLGDTIDGLLARLETAFESQRRFVANASHELRTPLMLSQTLLQVALANPALTLVALRATCQEVIDVGKDQAQLIEALLTLARSQRGLAHRERVDLRAVVDHAINLHTPAAAARGVQVNGALADAEVSGDARLISRLVSNLIDNAIRYNLSGGRVAVEVVTSTTEATLTVRNTGPAVPPEEIGRLLEPFQRATPGRTNNATGLGLGLSIVADIAEAHQARLDVGPQPEGGLTIAVSFPRSPRPQADNTRREAAMALPVAPSDRVAPSEW